MRCSGGFGWFFNCRSNTGTGNAAYFSDYESIEYALGFTRDAEFSSLTYLTSPEDATPLPVADGTYVAWSIGDTLMKAAPATGNYVGWVCTSTASLVWREWGRIS
jgi:hypothetical protein